MGWSKMPHPVCLVSSYGTSYSKNMLGAICCGCRDKIKLFAWRALFCVRFLQLLGFGASTNVLGTGQVLHLHVQFVSVLKD